MIQEIYDKNEQIALIIKNNYSNNGLNFLTQENSIQQVAYISQKKNTVINAHIHSQIQRTIVGTPEVLFIKEGKIRLDLYTQDKKYIESTILETGDIAILQYGGHGIKCLENSKFIEVKQGPYLGVKDKEIFSNIKEEEVIINE